MIESESHLCARFDLYMSDLEKLNDQHFAQQNLHLLNPNLPPKPVVTNEPYGNSKEVIIANGVAVPAANTEEYLILVNKLNEFADNTFTFGESLLKKMEEVNINEKI